MSVDDPVAVFHAFVTHRRGESRQKKEQSWRPEARPGTGTQKRQAAAVVPEVEGTITVDDAPRGTLDEMDVLWRYGHRQQVRQEIERWLRDQPEALSLRRDVVEFFLARKDIKMTIESLLQLAALLFENGNIHGVRKAIAQVLSLQPDHPRALRLQELIDGK